MAKERHHSDKVLPPIVQVKSQCYLQQKLVFQIKVWVISVYFLSTETSAPREKAKHCKTTSLLVCLSRLGLDFKLDTISWARSG